MLTVLLAALIQSDAATYEDPAKEIQWARSFEQAFEEAALRNVPVWIFLTSDN